MPKVMEEMEKAILRRDFQSFSELTMKVPAVFKLACQQNSNTLHILQAENNRVWVYFSPIAFVLTVGKQSDACGVFGHLPTDFVHD